MRGQVAEAVAPAGFELNNPWKVRWASITIVETERDANFQLVGEALQLITEYGRLIENRDGQFEHVYIKVKNRYVWKHDENNKQPDTMILSP